MSEKKGKRKTIAVRIMKLCLTMALGATILVGVSSAIVSGQEMSTIISEQMTVIAEQTADTVTATVDSDFNYLEGIATSSVVYGMSDDPVAQKRILLNMAEDRGAKDIGFADINGKTLTSDLSTYGDLSERDYFQSAIAGNRAVSDPLEDQTQPGTMVMMFAVPVYQDGDPTTGKIVGVLYALQDGNYLSNITNKITFGESGFAYMINSKGTNIAYTDSEKVLNQENALETFGDDPDFASLCSLLNKVLAGGSGYSTYSYGGTTKCVGYAEIPDYGWHIICSENRSELFRGQLYAIQFTVLCIAVVLVIVIISTLFFVKRLVAPLKRLNDINNSLADGDLTREIDLARDGKNQDEIGQMVNSTSNFVEKLKDVVGETKKSSGTLFEISNKLKSLANQSEEAADNVCQAIEDVSQATVNQAMQVDTATGNVVTLAKAIDNIREDVENLMGLAESAMDAEKISQNALTDLIESNVKTTVAFDEISEQINATDVAAQKISEAANLITEIASQTNLLSLNASIEAARAGEAGKGFAVVATEIQQLSIQSDTAATTIQDIIRELTDGSTKSITKMNEALLLIKEQEERLKKTEAESGAVDEDVEEMECSAEAIKKSVEACEEVKESVNNVVTNLSAISQENAASAEETNAAMEELNANIGVIATTATTLAEISDELSQYMSFWEI